MGFWITALPEPFATGRGLAPAGSSKQTTAAPFVGAAVAFVKKATTGYAGGHKEIHLWMEKENLR